jgi:hypothetical protein
VDEADRNLSVAEPADEEEKPLKSWRSFYHPNSVSLSLLLSGVGQKSAILFEEPYSI